MARGRSKYDEELCLKHDGTISGFRDLPRAFGSLEDCVPLSASRSWTGPGITALATALGTILTGGSALGAIAAGWSSSRIVQAYLEPIREFRIEKLKKGVGSPLLFVDGFLTQDSTIESWQAGLEKVFPSRPWYRLQWESHNLLKLGSTITETAGRLRLSAGRSRLLFLDVIHNPWHVALWKAERTGRLLGLLLARLQQRTRIHLLGHSLGARVAFEAMQTIGAFGARPIASAHLLGAAVDRSDSTAWALARKGAARVTNHYSRHDDVLRYLYRPGNLFLSDPAGLGPVEFRAIQNQDASRFVRGHTRYSTALPRLLHPGP